VKDMVKGLNGLVVWLVAGLGLDPRVPTAGFQNSRGGVSSQMPHASPDPASERQAEPVNVPAKELGK